MLNKIIEFSVKNKLIIGLFVLALIGYGAYQVTQLPIGAKPDITNNQVQIITVAPALGAADVERLISFPIEQATKNIPELEKVRSFSRFGLSVVTLIFDDKTDVYWARQLVSQQLETVKGEIPQQFGTPELGPITTGLGEIYQYTLRPKKGYEDKYDATELRTIQDWIVRQQLLGVKGVAEVSSFGGFLKQYEVAVNPAKLKAYDITISDVFKALNRNNQNTGGAYIEKGPNALFIRSEGLVGKLDDIRNIVIKNLPDGIPLLINDVAKVDFGHATRYGALTRNGKEVSGAVVMMLKGANASEVIENVKLRVNEIEENLPEGLTIDPFLDQTKLVNHSINTVTENLLLGALIVIFVLVFFLGDFRSGLIVASVIPLAMLFTVIMMNISGVTGNLMSLGALDFGLIVDGAVIIVEAVLHEIFRNRKYREKGHLTQSQMDKEVSVNAKRMLHAAIFGEIIILIVYTPILTLQGIEGKMFRPMAETVAYALIGAIILSLTYVPMMSALFLSKKVSQKENFSQRIMKRLENFYQHFLVKALRARGAILSIVILIFVAAIFVFTKLGGVFIPELPEGDFAVEMRVLPGSNIDQSNQAAAKASKILLSQFPEVEQVVGKTGSSEVPTDPMPIEATDLMIVLKDQKEWTSAKTYDELSEKMTKALSVIPGVTFGFAYPVEMRFNELLSGAKQQVVCKIFGDDLDSLANYAQQLGDISKTVKGVSGLYVEQVTGLPQIVIKYNRAAISQYGLDISNINDAVNAAFAGGIAGKVYEGQRRFDLVVKLQEDKRKGLTDVQNLLIATPSGAQIPLSTVANVSIKEGPIQIQREDGQRRIIVGFNAQDRDVQSLVDEVKNKVDKQMKLAPGYYINYGGDFQNLQEAKVRLGIVLPVALFLILLLLYFSFKSIRDALLIFSAVPLSVIGGIMALGIRGMPFSISAGIGFIALFGVAVLNGMVMISEFKKLKEDGFKDIRRIVIQGAKTRLRPVLMTASVASIGFLPMAISTGLGAQVQKPLATVVIGGLMVATFLTLIVLPILYIMFHKKIRFSKKSIKVITVIAFCSFGTIQSVKAQTPISLEKATQMALDNNLNVKNQSLKSKYKEKLTKSAQLFKSTSIGVQYGQFNSLYKDKEVGISQTLNFPTVYTSNKKFLNNEWTASVLQVDVRKVLLRRDVSKAYFSLLYLQQKEKLLRQNDSLFDNFLTRASQRFEAGESNILEKTTAENLRNQIALQLSTLQNDKEIAQLQFQLLLNTNTVYTPIEVNKDIILLSVETLSLANHPILKYLEQQEKTANAFTASQKALRWPDITFGYNLQGMKGVDTNDKMYENQLRLSYFNVGLRIPIFGGGLKARIDAAKVNSQVAKGEYEAKMLSIKKNAQSALAEYQKFNKEVLYYQNTGLKNAQTITSTANQQFKSGAIDYLNWVLLTNQAIVIRSNYVEALKNRNLKQAELEFYLSK